MRPFYNILQLLLSPLLAICLLFIIFTKKEKWHTLKPRFGYGIRPFKRAPKKGPVIWIHALSVGETTSAVPLITEIVREEPEISIVFSVTTTSGRKLADEQIASLVDAIVPFPLDIYFVVETFIDKIKPDLFVLVETDFWPNLLGSLRSRNIPAILVNGRVSEKSMSQYHRYRSFFKPMFDNFNSLCVQTSVDAENFIRLGINKNKLKTLGNLKYRSGAPARSLFSIPFTLLPGNLFIICGSTHGGEEEIILTVYKELIAKHPHLNIAIAPRHPSRADAIIGLANDYGLSTTRYSSRPERFEDLLLIDTIGDLAELYSTCDIAFIGGSLVAEGGHNPLEAAFHGIPTIFGPYMDDFHEISQELVQNLAAIQVSGSSSLYSALDRLISSDQFREDTGLKVKDYMSNYQNVIPAHLAIIRKHL
mgnify:CR=1 FL=1